MDAKSFSHLTVGSATRRCAERLDAAGVFFGHGTACPEDEALALVVAAVGGDFDDPVLLDQRLTQADVQRVESFMGRRVEERLPLPYITGEAWFAGRCYAIDQRALIPRSPFAELVLTGFSPWLASPPKRILDIGTGCGCIAIAAGLAFPESMVVGTDIEPGPLELAMVNRERHQMTARLDLVRADLGAGLAGPFDLIISNPPYVGSHEGPSLPAEYRHEPRAALFCGNDGLDLPSRILQDAARLLAPDGLLALEVGSGWSRLEAAHPALSITWVELELGGEGIGLVTARALAEAFD